MYRLLIITGLLGLFNTLWSQTFTEVDSVTYKLYQEKRWDDLIRSGRKALKLDYDYYYLRMRIGIAFYEKRNYKSAQIQFRKALELNELDPITLEYLYYAYLLGGQSQQAFLVYKDFPPALKNKIPDPGLKSIDRVSVEYLYSYFNTDELTGDPATFESLPAGVQLVTRDFMNLNLTLQHQMHPGTSLLHAYTYLGKDNFYYYDDGVENFAVDGHRVNQHQYYLSPSFTLAGGLMISPSFHFLYLEYQVPDLGAGGTGSGTNGLFREASVSQEVLGLKFTLYRGPFSFRFGATGSNLNQAKQLTGSGGLTWYPAGNLDFYLGAGLNVHLPEIEEGKAEWIPDLSLGYGIASRVWTEISGSYGVLKNYAESNGYLVYNGLDWMRYKLAGNLLIPITKKGSLVYAGARFAGYENRYIAFDAAQPENINNLSYSSISIFGGISWKF